MIHDLPRIIGEYRSSKQLVSVTGLVSMMYTCIFDIQRHAEALSGHMACCDM